MRQIARSSLLVALLLAVGPGCFVFDEIDSGMEKMKASSPHAKAEAEPVDEAPAPTGKDGKPVDLAAWWKKARTPTSGPREGDPAMEIVSCRIGGEVRFMSRTDCEVQGGRF